VNVGGAGPVHREPASAAARAGPGSPAQIRRHRGADLTGGPVVEAARVRRSRFGRRPS